MKKGLFAIVLIVVLAVFILCFTTGFLKITGKAISTEMQTIGPSSSDQACMMDCMKCTSIGVGCTGNQQECQTKCNVKKPEVTEETSCMESCVLVGCTEFDFSCQGNNKDKCEKECNMIKEPEAKSEEEQCIRDCVNLHSPGTICKPSHEGEQGNDVCQMCSQQCVHLYAGPCLVEEKLEQKKKDCQTCEKCYGEPVMGDSGEGWECIVDVQCKDASSEFGDNPGTGEGIATKVGDAVGNVFEAIGDFFRGIFGGSDSNSDEAQKTEEQTTETNN